MGSATQLVFPSAIIGSTILAIFAFLVTAGISPSAVASIANPVASATQAVQLVQEPSLQQVPTQQPTLVDSTPQVEPAPTAVPEEPTKEEPAEEEPAKSGKCKVSGSFPDKILQWCDDITRYSKKAGLDPDLVAALVWQESGGNPLAYSKSGAVGLMQVMPRDGIAASFMCVNGPCFTNRPTIADLQDPVFNIQYGTGMLANLVAKYGDIRDALMYYGPRDVGYYYADKVLAIYESNRK
ncbi:MAG TPA: transglycosylase SLT domain-containing protein [Anaerolineales bacterium]|jgi:soluble lytic murein transglycosylase-like protein|nr:transglycosylase SLT domain-containing protein [Anaerolineales bacterium]